MRCSPVFMNAQNAAAQLLARKQTTSVSSQWSFDGSFRACATNSSNLESRTLGWETGSTSCSRGQGRQFSLQRAGHYRRGGSSVRMQGVYLIGREPVMRMSTSLLALCCQSGPDATWETPISARSRSNGSRSLRMSPLFIARATNESIAPLI
jgi:hypothetical protein